ncbi:MAG: hypothetical protein ACOX62_06890 [Christensenellales bacterium]|jgi:hypothetical protein
MQQNSNQVQRWFLVTAKCGHVGRGRYLPVTFAVIAQNARHAAARARQYPRVKRHHKNAILRVEEIGKQTYLAAIEQNNQDPYLRCRSRKEQAPYEEQIQARTLPETASTPARKEQEGKPLYLGKTILRSPRAFLRNNTYQHSKLWGYDLGA